MMAFYSRLPINYFKNAHQLRSIMLIKTYRWRLRSEDSSNPIRVWGGFYKQNTTIGANESINSKLPNPNKPARWIGR